MCVCARVCVFASVRRLCGGRDSVGRHHTHPLVDPPLKHRKVRSSSGLGEVVGNFDSVGPVKLADSLVVQQRQQRTTAKLTVDNLDGDGRQRFQGAAPYEHKAGGG